jgi:diamine N-acetyltransferase
MFGLLHSSSGRYPVLGVACTGQFDDHGGMNDPLHLRLARIDQHNWRASLEVRVAPDQLAFVAGYQPVSLVILAKAYVRPGDLDWEPLALMTEDSVVGVAALAHSATRTELFHLAVDSGTQGRGVGTAAVALVLAHVSETRPGCEEVQLTVHTENKRAQRLYRRSGFLPTGQLRDGEPIWLLKINRGGGSGGIR